MSNKLSMGNGVPFVVTYRRILRKPQIKRSRRYVGAWQTAKNILAKVVEFIDDAAFETTVETVDPGRSVTVNWAIDVEDPFDTTTGRERNLIAYRMLNDIPPSGMHFEILSAGDQQSLAKASDPDTTDAEMTPEQFAELSKRQRQQNLLQETRDANGKFRRPVDSAYTHQPIETINEDSSSDYGSS